MQLSTENVRPCEQREQRVETIPATEWVICEQCKQPAGWNRWELVTRDRVGPGVLGLYPHYVVVSKAAR